MAAEIAASQEGKPLLAVSQHLARLAEIALLVLVDTRRRVCHALIFNYFVALGGMRLLGQRMGDAAQTLWAALDAPATPSAAAAETPGGDAVMADAPAASAGAGSSAAGAGAAGTAAAADGSGDAGGSGSNSSSVAKRDPKLWAEKSVSGYLQVTRLQRALTRHPSPKGGS